MKLMTTNSISATPADCVKSHRDELAKHLEGVMNNLQEAINEERRCRNVVSEADAKLKEFDAWLETANVLRVDNLEGSK